MKKIIIKEIFPSTILLDNINEYSPIFAKEVGSDDFCGMIVKEDKGWILRTGGHFGATGHHASLKKCLNSCDEPDYEFYIY